MSFLGNTSNSIKIFGMQKEINLRIVTNSKKMDSCRELLKTMEISHFYCQYIFSLLLYR